MQALLKARPWSLLFGLLVALMIAAVIGSARPALAAFPGSNGKIASASSREGDFEIFTVNPDGTWVTNVTNTDFSFREDDPAWSADGTRIAYENNHNEVWVMNADGSAQTRLTPAGIIDFAPAWSPDGTKIAFSSVGSSFSNPASILVMNADGTGRTNLAPGNGPAWAPDGAKIAFYARAADARASSAVRSHVAAGVFRRCCFRVQIEARGELANTYDYDDGVGTHVISWRWSARELVEYREEEPFLSRALSTSGSFAPGELKLVFEERRNITDPTPESGEVAGPGSTFDPCRYRFSTGGYRSDRGRTASSFVRLQRYAAHPPLKTSRYLVAEVDTSPFYGGEVNTNTCAARGEHTVFDLPIPLQGFWHGLQGPLAYALPPPPLSHFRQKRRIVVADRQAFTVPAHAGARHTSKASTNITVTFTYVPEAPGSSGGGTGAGRCANPKTGTPRDDRLTGTQGSDLLLGLGGDDILLGLGGDDCLIGGPGRDTVDAGAGNDVVTAKDGTAETVRCGPGTDTVIADRSDRLIACERVSRG